MLFNLYKKYTKTSKGEILMSEQEYKQIIVNKYEKNKLNPLVKGISFMISKLLQLLFIILILIIITIPTYLILFCRKMFMGIPMFESTTLLVRNSRLLKMNFFNLKGNLLKYSSLIFEIFIGNINFVGNSFLYQNISDIESLNLISKYGHPGIFNLWFIRESTKIAHEGLKITELEYLATKSFKRDLSIIIKTFPALMYRSSENNYHEKLNIFDLEFDNITMKQGIDIIEETIDSNKKKTFFFVNPDCLNKLYKDKEYFSILEKADYVFPDGIGISIACNILKTPLLENVNGTDMLPYLCELSEKKNYSMFLFGAKPTVAEKMKKKLEEKFPKLKVVGTRNGYFDWNKDSDKIVAEINASQANILLVAFGVPLQEKWINENLPKLKSQVLMGVGGLFDFYSGEMNRAPKWMREIGLEWLFRLMKEPKRMWKRYIIGNPLFIYRVYKWKNKKIR